MIFTDYIINSRIYVKIIIMMKSTKLTIILAVTDILLLAAILFLPSPDAKTGSDPVEETVTPVVTGAPKSEAKITPEPVETPIPDETPIPNSDRPLPDDEENPFPDEDEVILEQTGLDVSLYDTDELPTINDFKWVTQDILDGKCPDEAKEMLFEDSLGGWKCYIKDHETETERLASAKLSGTEENLKLEIDWYYARTGGKEGQVNEDTTADSVYEGFVNDKGQLEAYGQGNIYLTDIYVMDDHMYAFGTIGWPDGVEGDIMLVRP